MSPHTVNILGQRLAHEPDAPVPQVEPLAAKQLSPIVSIRYVIDERTGRPIYLVPGDPDYDNALDVAQAVHEELREAGYPSAQGSALVEVAPGQVVRIGLGEGNEGLTRLEKIILKIVLAVVAAQLAAHLTLIWSKFVEHSRIAQAIGDQVKRLEPTYKTIKDRIDREEERIKGIIDTSLVRNSLAILRVAHTVGSLTSQTYRDRVDKLYQETRNISRQVFGESSQLSSALGLLRLSVADLTALSGDRADLGDQRWFNESLRLTEFVEANSAKYAQFPSQFWTDLNIQFIDPILAESKRQNDQRWSVVDSIRSGLEKAALATVTVSDSFDDYRTELGHFLSPENRRDLNTAARDFDRRIRFPLRSLSAVVTEQFPEIEKKVIEVEAVTNRQQEEIDTVTERTSEPEEISEEQAARNRERITRTLGSGPPAERPEVNIENAMTEISMIERTLPRR